MAQRLLISLLFVPSVIVGTSQASDTPPNGVVHTASLLKNMELDLYYLPVNFAPVRSTLGCAVECVSYNERGNSPKCVGFGFGNVNLSCHLGTSVEPVTPPRSNEKSVFLFDSSAFEVGANDTTTDVGSTNATFDVGPTNATFDVGQTNATFDVGPTTATFDVGLTNTTNNTTTEQPPTTPPNATTEASVPPGNNNNGTCPMGFFRMQTTSSEDVDSVYCIGLFDSQLGTFLEVRQNCSDLVPGADLLTMSISLKMQAVNGLILYDNPRVWIGIERDPVSGKWKWITGEDVGLDQFAAGPMPDPPEHCAVIENGEFYEESCQAKHGFLCEAPVIWD